MGEKSAVRPMLMSPGPVMHIEQGNVMTQGSQPCYRATATVFWIARMATGHYNFSFRGGSVVAEGV